MAGMEGLGRVFNVVPIAASQILKLRVSSAVSFVTTGADTFTVTVGVAHTAAATSPGTILSHYWKAVAATNGTVAWTRVTQTAADNWVVAGAATSVATVFGSMVPDTYQYIKVVPSGAGLVTAIFHDLVVQRDPRNLEVLNV